jgi:hypothetical protein
MSDMQDALEAIADKLPAYAHYYAYYNGQHRFRLASERFKTAFGAQIREFKENLCPAIIEATADKLSITGFRVETREEGQGRAGRAAWDIWKANRMEVRSGEVHLEALRAGDAYVIVWQSIDGQQVLLYPNSADLMHVEYDDERPGLIRWAAKCWYQDDKYLRFTLYYADRIEKYIARSPSSDTTLPSPGGIDARMEPHQTEGEAWPLENPWGIVPVFHFANNAPIGSFGRSELCDTIELQDGLNKSHGDRFVGQEFMALPQRWATGIEVDAELDPLTGKPRPPFQAGAERLWATAATDAQFGQFPAADLANLTRTIDDFRLAMARVSGTPLHYMFLTGGQWPSGEAMKTAEARHTAKVQDRQLSYGAVWADVMALAVRMAPGGSTTQVQFETLWKDPQPRNERDFLESLKIKRELGVSADQAMREMGYSEEQIAKMVAEARSRAEAFGLPPAQAAQRTNAQQGGDDERPSENGQRFGANVGAPNGRESAE